MSEAGENEFAFSFVSNHGWGKTSSLRALSFSPSPESFPIGHDKLGSFDSPVQQLSGFGTYRFWATTSESILKIPSGIPSPSSKYPSRAFAAGILLPTRVKTRINCRESLCLMLSVWRSTAPDQAVSHPMIDQLKHDWMMVGCSVIWRGSRRWKFELI